jgi:hypothetical protein
LPPAEIVVQSPVGRGDVVPGTIPQQPRRPPNRLLRPLQLKEQPHGRLVQFEVQPGQPREAVRGTEFLITERWSQSQCGQLCLPTVGIAHKDLRLFPDLVGATLANSRALERQDPLCRLSRRPHGPRPYRALQPEAQELP